MAWGQAGMHLTGGRCPCTVPETPGLGLGSHDTAMLSHNLWVNMNKSKHATYKRQTNSQLSSRQRNLDRTPRSDQHPSLTPPPYCTISPWAAPCRACSLPGSATPKQHNNLLKSLGDSDIPDLGCLARQHRGGAVGIAGRGRGVMKRRVVGRVRLGSGGRCHGIVSAGVRESR